MLFVVIWFAAYVFSVHPLLATRHLMDKLMWIIQYLMSDEISLVLLINTDELDL